MAMKQRTEGRVAGRGEPGAPGEPRPATRTETSVRLGRRYGEEERKRLLAELERTGETLDAFCARHGLSTATLCKWRKAVREHGEAGLAPRESRRNPGGRTSKPRSPDERRAAVEAFARSRVGIGDFARTFGVSSWTLRNWLSRYRAEGPKGLESRRGGPKPGTGGARRRVSPAVRDEIVRTRLRFPDFGLKKVRDFLRRFQGIGVSTGTVARTLKERGVARAVPQPKLRRRPPAPRRFERARPCQLWQTDITSFMLTRARQRVYLVAFVDDFSRYVVSHALSVQQRGQLVIEALLEGIARYGKPKEVLSDQGRQYYAWRGKSEFQRVLKREGIEHVVARAHHPQTVGKCERLWKTIKEEFWERARPQDLAEARERLGHFIAHYNFFRPHQGIDGLVPADRFFGAESALRRTLEARLCKDELGAALAEAPRTGVYLFGQIGDEQVSLVGEKGQLLVQTSSGVRREIGLEELGAPQAQAAEVKDGSSSSNGCEDGGIPGAGEKAADAQEAAEVQPAGLLPARSEGALDERERRGADAGAPCVHADPGPVDGQAPALGGGGGALGAALAGVAALAAGAVGDAGGSAPSAAAAAQEGGVRDGAQGGRSSRAQEADPGARGGPCAQPGPDPAALEPAQAREWGAGVEDLDLGGEQNARSASEGGA
jgi:transposase InsO family protein